MVYHNHFSQLNGQNFDFFKTGLKERYKLMFDVDAHYK